MTDISDGSSSDGALFFRSALSRRTLLKLGWAGALSGMISGMGGMAFAGQKDGNVPPSKIGGLPPQGDFSMLELVKKRRSIRRYSQEPIDRATLDAILKIALFAPASHGTKVVEFVVVENKETLDALARCKRIGAPSVRAAAAAVVVIVDRRGELWIEDASVASAYLLLAAEAYGIGACWNHIRGRQGEHASSEEEIRNLLGIPDRYAVLSIVAMGHKGEHKPAYSDADVSLRMIHHETFHG